jgi:small-conductance mechanosensitive channel
MRVPVGATFMTAAPLLSAMRESIGVPVVVVAAALAAQLLAFFVLRRAVAHPGQVLAQSLVRNLRGPTRLAVPLIALEVTVPLVGIGSRLESDLMHGFGIALIMAVAFLIIRLTYVFDDVLLDRYRTDSSDNLKARQIQTQVQVLRRVIVVAVTTIASAIALLTFPEVRAAGAGLLASAGIVGLVAGMAAKPILTNVLAGLQIAISQPIRVDDVVVIDEDWGRIEQIALTYVVVRVWDLRRLVVPISYFIENPFENWTKRTADIMGFVYLEVDYTTPIDLLRKQFHNVLQASPDWDGQVEALQVTNAGPTTIQLRALMSSPDSTRSWNLQVEVREKLIAYLQKQFPGCLPRQRTEIVGADGLDALRPASHTNGHRPDGVPQQAHAEV